MRNISLLTGPWEDYDNRKWLADKDRNIFCPDDPWELNYLVALLQECFPEHTEISIILSIRKATKALPPPRHRKRFLEYITMTLEKEQGLDIEC